MILLSSNLFALEGMKVLKVSSTGQTIILDRGHLEGIKQGQRGRLLYQSGLDDPKLTLVANAEVIKVSDKYSFWFLSKIDNSQLVSEGQKLLFAKLEDVMSGRKTKLRKKRVFLPKNKSVVQYLKDEEVGIPDELIYKGHDYIEGDTMVTTNIAQDEHLEVRSFEDWKVQYGLTYVDDYMQEIENKYVSGEDSNNVDINNIKQQHDKSVFQSVVNGTVKKINDLEFGLNGLYRDQKRDPDLRIITDRVQVENFYEKDHRERREAKRIEPYAEEKLKRQGERWSADLDSAELRRFFVNSGIAKEKERQRLALETKQGHELLLRIASSLINHTTVDDINHQGTGYSVGFGYEFHLSRTTLTLDRFSVELGFERAIRYFDMGGINGRFYEGSFFAGLNFYLFNKPYNLNMYLWYLGFGIRRGDSSAQSSDLSKEYSYQFISVPTLQAGLKYRFYAGDERDNTLRIGLGYNLLVSYETLRYSVNETIADSISGLFTVNDMRLFAGLSIYF